ncbi:MAG: MFS transporter [Deltaproteobacteria bacterium]|nr:MFS transporter [Deltaproteobacteria bacterium]
MHSPRPEIPSYRETYFIVILALGFLIQLTSLGFGRFAYTALLPSMKTDLGLSNTRMGFFQVGILTGYLLFAYLCSLFSKRWGLSIVVAASCALAGLAMTALGLVSSFYLCLMLAFLMGAGAVGAYIPLVPLIIGWSSVRWSGGAIGFALSGTGVGIIVVGYLAPFILSRFGPMGWRYAWIILGAGTLLVALISFFLLKENPSAIDLQAGQNTPDSTLKMLYRDPSLRAILTVYLLVGFGYIMYATFVVAYAIEEIGLSVKEAGLIWSVFGLFAVAGCFLWGMISDHLGRKSMTIVSLLLLSASILLSILWKEKTGLLISGALFAFTFNGLITMIASMFGDYIPISKMGRIFGVSTLIHGVGQAAGVALAGYLKDLTATFVVPFLLSALIIGICPVFLLSLKEQKGRRPQLPH